MLTGRISRTIYVNLKIRTGTRMVTDGTCDTVTNPNSVRHVIERDGRKRLKKLLYAQKPHVYVHNKSLTLKRRT